MTATPPKKRDKWQSKTQFLLACIGYAVGLGNIWRFPYLCFRSGGGAFLIPYFIMLVFCAVPLLYMEMAVGQLTRAGPIQAITMLCPILKGVGLTMVALSFFLSTYYNVIIAWALQYLFSSFTNPLPWRYCDEIWSSDLCSADVGNVTSSTNSTTYNESLPSLPRQSPSHEYFNNYVLQISDGVDDVGGFNNRLVGYLFLAWVLCYLCVFKGVHSAGKVVYFTAVFPYVILLVLLIRSVTLPGAANGLRFLFIPKWKLLLDPNVWLLAAAQVFGGIGISYGSLIAFSSYNDERNNIYHDTLAISIANSVTSLFAGCVVFSSLGVVAHRLNVPVSEAVAAGPDLVFVAIPPLFVDLPGANVWAIMFFLMLICLGIDSQFSMVEVINTCIFDHFGHKLENIPRRKELVSFAVCVVCFLCGLPHVTKAGMYIFTLIDNYAVYVPVMFVAYFEVMAICWIYGGNRLAREISFLSGHRPCYFFPFCWVFVSPLLITVITGASIIQMKLVTFGSYSYPVWAHVIGGIISVMCLMWIPIGMLHELYKNGQGKSFYESFFKSVTATFVPEHATRKEEVLNGVKSQSADETKEKKNSGETASPEQPLLSSNGDSRHRKFDEISASTSSPTSTTSNDETEL